MFDFKKTLPLTLLIIFISLFLQSVSIQICDSYAQQSRNKESARKKVELLGKAIRGYQKKVVWPGGNQYSGCYMWTHRENFLNRGGAKRIVEEAQNNPVFWEGVEALRLFNKTERFSYYHKWEIPVYPTWAMIGEISSRGTTDAGYITQKEIAKALVQLVKDMFLHPEKYKK